MDKVSISHAEPCGRKFPAILTPPMKAIIIGLGKKPSPMIAEKIGRSMMVTGVPARNADMRVVMPNVINTARYMLLFTKLTKIVEINSEKPKYDKEFERINNIANVIIIFQSMSLLISENLEFLE